MHKVKYEGVSEDFEMKILQLPVGIFIEEI